MRRATATLATLIALSVSVVAGAQTTNECLLSLTATGATAQVSRRGRMVTATADSTGMCSFTVTACVDDAMIANCAPGQVTKVRLMASGTDVRAAIDGLEQDLQQSLPAAQQTCQETTVRIGQTRHRRIRGAVVTDDSRRNVDDLTLMCECGGGATQFSSTFQGIQKAIFENHGCTQDACHGSSMQSGLDLRAGASYQNLFEVPSTESSFKRVEPGDKDRSFLWLKLAASTDPSQLPPGVQVAGAPMPNGLPPLSKDELEAVRLWIYTGAPQTGTVTGTEALLNACLPPAEPLHIKPLDPPAPGEGIQFVMPPWKLEAHSEHEICFATYYDLTSQVPTEFQDPSGTLFRFNTTDLRQDPQSHHLILNRYVGSADVIHDPSFGTWTCNGGDKAGQVCEPTDLTSCGTGTCTSEIKQSFACIGFGPQTGGAPFYAIGGAQKAQSHDQYLDGVFAQIPMKGILYWNSHAFNLTDEDTMMHARLNYLFAKDTQYPVQGIFDTSKIFGAHAAPYTTETLCNDFVLPQGARLFNLQSHTHKHGKHFTVTVPDGTQIYESFVYNDPVVQTYDPPLAFDSPNPQQRTLHYCSLYNNGVAPDDSPDPQTVTRYSRLPQSARNSIGLCTPVACAAGKIGAPCRGTSDNRTCDSSPGAGDGLCDACPITGGESTENEMFILIGSYYIDPGAAAQGNGGGAALADATGRSLSTEVAVPPQVGCSSSHAGHAGH